MQNQTGGQGQQERRNRQIPTDNEEENRSVMTVQTIGKPHDPRSVVGGFFYDQVPSRAEARRLLIYADIFMEDYTLGYNSNRTPEENFEHYSNRNIRGLITQDIPFLMARIATRLAPSLNIDPLPEPQLEQPEEQHEEQPKEPEAPRGQPAQEQGQPANDGNGQPNDENNEDGGDEN